MSSVPINPLVNQMLSRVRTWSSPLRAGADADPDNKSAKRHCRHDSSSGTKPVKVEVVAKVADVDPFGALQLLVAQAMASASLTECQSKELMPFHACVHKVHTQAQPQQQPQESDAVSVFQMRIQRQVKELIDKANEADDDSQRVLAIQRMLLHSRLQECHDVLMGLANPSETVTLWMDKASSEEVRQLVEAAFMSTLTHDSDTNESVLVQWLCTDGMVVIPAVVLQAALDAYAVVYQGEGGGGGGGSNMDKMDDGDLFRWQCDFCYSTVGREPFGDLLDSLLNKDAIECSPPPPSGSQSILARVVELAQRAPHHAGHANLVAKLWKHTSFLASAKATEAEAEAEATIPGLERLYAVLFTPASRKSFTSDAHWRLCLDIYMECGGVLDNKEVMNFGVPDKAVVWTEEACRAVKVYHELLFPAQLCQGGGKAVGRVVVSVQTTCNQIKLIHMSHQAKVAVSTDTCAPDAVVAKEAAAVAAATDSPPVSDTDEDDEAQSAAVAAKNTIETSPDMRLCKIMQQSSSPPPLLANNATAAILLRTFLDFLSRLSHLVDGLLRFRNVNPSDYLASAEVHSSGKDIEAHIKKLAASQPALFWTLLVCIKALDQALLTAPHLQGKVVFSPTPEEKKEAEEKENDNVLFVNQKLVHEWYDKLFQHRGLINIALRSVPLLWPDQRMTKFLCPPHEMARRGWKRLCVSDATLHAPLLRTIAAFSPGVLAGENSLKQVPRDHLLAQLLAYMEVKVSFPKQHPDISFLGEAGVGDGVIVDALQTLCRSIFIDCAENWEYSESSGSFGPAAVPLQKDSKVSGIYEVAGWMCGFAMRKGVKLPYVPHPLFLRNHVYRTHESQVGMCPDECFGKWTLDQLSVYDPMMAANLAAMDQMSDAELGEYQFSVPFSDRERNKLMPLIYGMSCDAPVTRDNLELYQRARVRSALAGDAGHKAKCWVALVKGFQRFVAPAMFDLIDATMHDDQDLVRFLGGPQQCIPDLPRFRRAVHHVSPNSTDKHEVIERFWSVVAAWPVDQEGLRRSLVKFWTAQHFVDIYSAPLQVVVRAKRLRSPDEDDGDENGMDMVHNPLDYADDEDPKTLKIALRGDSEAQVLGQPKVALAPLSAADQAAEDCILPTANTCMRKLILPRYSSEAVLSERLLYALKHGNDSFGIL